MNRSNALKLFILVFTLLFTLTHLNTQQVNAQMLGQDWTGQFFNNTSFSGYPIAEATFPQGLNCNWSQGVNNCVISNPEPIYGVGPNKFSATFSSTQQFEQSGKYLFTLRYNDGIRVSINDIVLHDDMAELTDPSTQPQPCTDLCKQVQIVHNITAGEIRMRVDYVQFFDTSILQVQWGFLGDDDQLLTNGHFEMGDAGWSIKNPTGDKIKCNTQTKIYAYEGECAFRFKGVPGEDAKLVQASNVHLYLGPIELQGFVRAQGAVDGTVKLIVSYPNSNLPKQKLSVDVVSDTAGSYIPLSILASSLVINVEAQPAKYKLILSNKGEGGKVLYDSLSVMSLGTVSKLLVQTLPLP